MKKVFEMNIVVIFINYFAFVHVYTKHDIIKIVGIFNVGDLIVRSVMLDYNKNIFSKTCEEEIIKSCYHFMPIHSQFAFTDLE